MVERYQVGVISASYRTDSNAHFVAPAPLAIANRPLCDFPASGRLAFGEQTEWNDSDAQSNLASMGEPQLRRSGEKVPRFAEHESN